MLIAQALGVVRVMQAAPALRKLAVHSPFPILADGEMPCLSITETWVSAITGSEVKLR